MVTLCPEGHLHGIRGPEGHLHGIQRPEGHLHGIHRPEGHLHGIGPAGSAEPAGAVRGSAKSSPSWRGGVLVGLSVLRGTIDTGGRRRLGRGAMGECDGPETLGRARLAGGVGPGTLSQSPSARHLEPGALGQVGLPPAAPRRRGRSRGWPTVWQRGWFGKGWFCPPSRRPPSGLSHRPKGAPCCGSTRSCLRLSLWVASGVGPPCAGVIRLRQVDGMAGSTLGVDWAYAQSLPCSLSALGGSPGTRDFAEALAGAVGAAW